MERVSPLIYILWYYSELYMVNTCVNCIPGLLKWLFHLSHRVTVITPSPSPGRLTFSTNAHESDFLFQNGCVWGQRENPCNWRNTLAMNKFVLNDVLMFSRKQLNIARNRYINESALPISMMPVIQLWCNCSNNMAYLIQWGSSGPYYKHGLTLIPAWICNHIHYKVWDEITYPFLNFNGVTVEV